MSTVSIILCSVVGFMIGLVGWLAFGMGPVIAIAIWVGSGPVAALVAAIRTVTEARTRTEAGGIIKAGNIV